MKRNSSIVASVAIKPGNSKELVFDAVEKSMKLANWKRYVKGNHILLKINAVWDKVYPCATTSPIVIEGVLKMLTKHIKPKKITIADTDTAAHMHTDISFKVLGIDKLAKKYNADLISLTNTEFEVIPFDGLVLKELKISKTLLSADNIITMPILKTHGLSGITFSIKNQWGCIHDMRHNYHTVLAEALGDVNRFYKDKIRFCVADATIAMEGTGPKTGTPIEVGHVLASNDLVAMEAVGATIMGLNPNKLPTIKYAEKSGVGTRNFVIKGDEPPKLKFEKPNPKQIVFYTEMALRHLGPQIEWLLFKTPVLHIFRIAAKIYNDLWFNIFAKQKADTIMRTRWGQMLEEYVK